MRPRTAGIFALAAVAGLAAPAGAAAQVEVQDLVITLGGSVEAYRGNLSVVDQPVLDSTDHAIGVTGEVGVRGRATFFENFDLTFDGGMRQTAALGFVFRDYAPREWVGSTALSYSRPLGDWLSLQAVGTATGRTVRDRTPTPLFLQPGYAIGGGSLGVVSRSIGGVIFDVAGQVERADYRAVGYLPQLDLLDRRGKGVEVGARWGNTPSTLRVFGGVWWSDYEHQASFVADDPYRRDRTVRAGVDWSHFGEAIVQLGMEGTLNRSNSNRPEYDAVALRAAVTVPLPRTMTLNAYAVLTAKSYLHETDFARLVPGEEADNASVAYLQLVKPIADDLDGAVRLAWTRAEGDYGAQYYRRFGLSVEFNYRPLSH